MGKSYPGNNPDYTRNTDLQQMYIASTERDIWPGCGCGSVRIEVERVEVSCSRCIRDAGSEVDLVAVTTECRPLENEECNKCILTVPNPYNLVVALELGRLKWR